MAESIGPRGDRVSDPVRRRNKELSPGATTPLVVALSLLCWMLLIVLGRGLWSAFG
jgi:hypothetical protein